MNTKLATAFLLVLFVGCTSTKKAVKTEVKAEVILSETEKTGKELYDNRCGKCHKLFEPSAYTSAQWAPIMDKMQKPAKMTDEQKELVKKYLNVYAKK